MRQFESGATRDTDQGKLDYEGFLSPIVLRRFGKYMNKHRVQADGQLRDSDNWQKGIPLNAYMKSMHRHFMDVWASHRGAWDAGMEESLCALLFNVMGYLHEQLKMPHVVLVEEDGLPTFVMSNEVKPSETSISIDEFAYTPMTATQAVANLKEFHDSDMPKAVFDVKDLKPGDRVKVKLHADAPPDMRDTAMKNDVVEVRDIVKGAFCVCDFAGCDRIVCFNEIISLA